MSDIAVRRIKKTTRFSTFSWGVYIDGDLFEGFTSREAADATVEELRTANNKSQAQATNKEQR
jgi:hypothetical protein